ncbi:outer membrane beta-barrel protein [Qipengyuania sp. 6D47A]|uniref:Outer membrane beta-barrel protein n=1 Tax=Qipengyuania qiaonensis TaxID=2867240 RepID=A0ABS7JF50_9SPHN|nr:outer membrane beta-barrel protein [Qipengyuania qiaonensis]
MAGYGTTPAAAQQDVQNQSVADRSRPDYTPEPIYVGGIAIEPTVVAGVQADNNIYARDDLKRGDALATLEPRVRATLDTGMLQTTFDVRSFHARYFSTAEENTDGFSAAGLAVYGDVTDTRVEGYLEYTNRSEDRSRIDSLTDTLVRGRYERSIARLGVRQRFGFLSLSGSAGVRRLDYPSVTDSNGVLQDYSNRNQTNWTLSGEANYSRSGQSSFFVVGQYNRRLYDIRLGDPEFDRITDFDRSAHGYRLEVGYARQITSLLYLKAQVGILRFDFDDPLLPTISGPAFDLSALWNVTPLTSIQGSLRRSIDESVGPDNAGIARTELSVTVDHELLRNLILSADGRFADLSPAGDFSPSTEYDARLSARYLVDRNWSIDGFAQYLARDTESASRNFNAVSAGVAVSYAF